MDIALGFTRKLVVEDMGNTVDVDTTCGHVRRDENVDLSPFEGIQGTQSRTLALVAVNRCGAELGGIELLRQPVGAVLGASEYNGALHLRNLQELAEYLALVFWLYMDEGLLHGSRSRLLRSNVDPHWLG